MVVVVVVVVVVGIILLDVEYVVVVCIIHVGIVVVVVFGSAHDDVVVDKTFVVVRNFAAVSARKFVHSSRDVAVMYPWQQETVFFHVTGIFSSCYLQTFSRHRHRIRHHRRYNCHPR